MPSDLGGLAASALEPNIFHCRIGTRIFLPLGGDWYDVLDCRVGLAGG